MKLYCQKIRVITLDPKFVDSESIATLTPLLLDKSLDKANT